MAKFVKRDDGYRPDHAALPGGIIWETMWERKAGSGWLADEIDITENGLLRRLRDEIKIESNIAAKIEEALDMPKGIIMRLDEIYRETKKRIKNEQRRD